MALASSSFIGYDVFCILNGSSPVPTCLPGQGGSQQRMRPEAIPATKRESDDLPESGGFCVCAHREELAGHDLVASGPEQRAAAGTYRSPAVWRRVRPLVESAMQHSQRRGRRPLAVVLVSEHRNGGVREFVFSDAPLRRGADSGPPRLSRALMTARAFAWADDLPAANDACSRPTRTRLPRPLRPSAASTRSSGKCGRSTGGGRASAETRSGPVPSPFGHPGTGRPARRTQRPIDEGESQHAQG